MSINLHVLSGPSSNALHIPVVVAAKKVWENPLFWANFSSDPNGIGQLHLDVGDGTEP